MTHYLPVRRLPLLFATSAGLIACTTSFAEAPPAAAQMRPAQTPAEQRARSFLLSFNSGSAEDVRQFVRANVVPPSTPDDLTVEDWVRGVGIFRHLVGTGEFVRFEARTRTTGDLIFRSELLDRLEKITVEVEAEPPHRITSIAWPERVSSKPVAARNDAERAALLDRYAQRLAKARSFSGVVVLARNGQPIFQKAYGRAERRFGVSNTLDTRFYAGSITKTFTAVAIAQLVEQGKIAWTDPLARFLPDFPTPEAASSIQIRHLLTHTSGLGGAFPPGSKIVPDSYRSVADYMKTAPQTPPSHPPGTKRRYSNLGYMLLGRIVEIASGEDYYDYISAHVFKPAGMTSAGTDSRDSIIPKLAYGYEPDYSIDDASFHETDLRLPARASPFGGAYVSAADLLRFERALRSGTLVSPQTWTLISTPRPELGAPDWGYGFAIDEPRRDTGRKTVGHGGNQIGACTSWRMIRDAEAPYTLIVLSNSGLEACTPIVHYVFDLIPPVGS